MTVYLSFPLEYHISVCPKSQCHALCKTKTKHNLKPVFHSFRTDLGKQNTKMAQ